MDAEPTIIFDFPGGWVSDLLDMFVSQVPDYKWEEVDGVIHVARRNAHVTLLDVAVSVDGLRNKTREELWENISAIPEIAAWLESNHCSRDQYSHGGQFRNHNAPISIDKGTITVEKLLDEISVQSGAYYWAVLQNPHGDSCRISINF